MGKKTSEMLYRFTDCSQENAHLSTGSEAHSREFSEEAYKFAGQPKELVIVPGAGHVDLYDRVNLIPLTN